MLTVTSPHTTSDMDGRADHLKSLSQLMPDCRTTVSLSGHYRLTLIQSRIQHLSNVTQIFESLIDVGQSGFNYLVKLYIDQTGKLQKDFRAELGDKEFVGQVEVESQWSSGYGRMTAIQFPMGYPSDGTDLDDLMRVRKWFQMNQHVPQGWELFQQAVFDLMADAVPFIDSEFRIDFDVNVGEVFQS